MKLIHNIAVRLSMALLPVIALWAMVFYFVIVDEINDEADDLLESYAEQLMVKKLSGKNLPVANIMTDGHYSISEVAESYANSHTGMEYYDADFYIQETDEQEPARFLKTIFRDREGRCFELIVATPTIEKEDLIKTILWWILALYLLLLLTVIVTTLVVFQKSMRPLYMILDWLNAYTPGKSHGRLSINSDIREFRQLEKAATDATDRSDRAFEKQKQFIGNASHELQTPLAVLGGRIDWMLDNDTLGEESVGELVQMKRELGHIVRLNKTLLLLTKIDNGQFPDVTDIDLSAMVLSQKELYGEIFSSKQITCSAQNAFVHSPEDGKVTLTLTENELVVENSGDSPLDSSRIFERFYQGSKKEGSTGLGLALAKTIADRCGMLLTYSYVDGMHRFSVKF